MAATLALAGLVWFVQVVHYPLLALVGRDAAAAYAAAHGRRTTWVVAPLMLVEAGTALALLLARPADVSGLLAALGAGLVAVVWLSTALLQVPRHRVLALGFDERAHLALVASNWLRTAAWTARGILVLWMVASAA